MSSSLITTVEKVIGKQRLSALVHDSFPAPDSKKAPTLRPAGLLPPKGAAFCLGAAPLGGSKKAQASVWAFLRLCLDYFQ